MEPPPLAAVEPAVSPGGVMWVEDTPGTFQAAPSPGAPGSVLL